MLSILYLAFFLTCGVACARWWLPRLRPIQRGYLGASFGLLMMMWLPALLAYAMRFSLAAHAVAAGCMAALCGLAFLTRDKRPRVRFSAEDRRLLRTLLALWIPLTLLAAWLQYSHSIRLAPDGSYHVGQSTYGDLQLHLAIVTSAVNAPFPLANSLMVDATMAYPYLADTFATSLYMLGLSLPAAMSVSGTVMMALVFGGYILLCAQLCQRRGAVALAVCLLFFNGGLGFFFTLSGRVENGVVTTAAQNLQNVIEGYYQTPTNQPDPNNLRWVNIICDMLVPQRGILGGWTMLLPCLNLLLPPLAEKRAPDTRALILLGLFAGGMPLVHTHSFLALALCSAGVCLWVVLHAPKGARWRAFRPFLLYGALAAVLSLPQLFGFTFVQATSSDHFLRLQFNWCNNRGNGGLVDPYLWFYIKNIGLPFLLILLALLEKRPAALAETPVAPADETELSTAFADDRPARDWVSQRRMIACGAFLIFWIAELVLFQPNEYDNNKLFYVWFLLCLPMAADYACALYDRLRDMGSRRALAGLFLVACFLSAGLTVARECVSDYQAYDASDRAVGAWVQHNTPEHSTFLTGNGHLNPVASLAGRTIVCGSDLYLYYHGFSTGERKAEVRAFYEAPQENLAFLDAYGVEYIYVSGAERYAYDIAEETLRRLFPVVYDENGRTIYKVGADEAIDPAEDVNGLG